MMARAGIKRLYVANRGEIAVRIIRACQKLGIGTVIGVSTADRESLAGTLADRAICIGPPAASASYLNMEAVVTAARETDCDAVHPGYGFLAENARFQRLCVQHELRFVGPSAGAIESLGDKVRARRIASELGVPIVAGEDDVESADTAMAFGRHAGYPFLFKASAGGGGRGMRLVRAPHEVVDAFESATAEARASFGNPQIYIERYVERARHVEIQLIADDHGNVVHLGERDCSIQRRHQKLIEESPSPVISDSLRSRMADSAIRLARHVGYTNAGTVEFLVDLDSKEYFFLEVNTRIQVEHPVTEMVTGVDLVAEQIRVANGMPLSISQEDVTVAGHAIECRINAEQVEKGFLPSPGTIKQWQPPTADGIRVDTHCYSGYVIPPFYDSLMAKLIVHGRDRRAAIATMKEALGQFLVAGVHTTIPFHQHVLDHADFMEGNATTRWVENTLLANAT